MDLIEQAVFTSAETDRSAGYHLVATSPGICDVDARQLAAWGPSHDSLLSPAEDAVSFNFHRLPSGAFCASRTTTAGWEYSSRGGLRVYTQCLIVSPGTLAQFANNPFALLKAALASGALRTYDKAPPRLEPIRLVGRAATVDASLLARLAGNPGPLWMATLVQAALRQAMIAIAGGPPAQHIIAGLVGSFPPACRTELTYSSGLKFSPRRPSRVLALPVDPDERCRVQRLYEMTVFDLDGDPPAQFKPIDAWPQLIGRVLRSQRIAFLASRLAEVGVVCSPGDLNALGLELLEELDKAALSPGDDRQQRTPGRPRSGMPSEPSRGTKLEVEPEQPWSSETPPRNDEVTSSPQVTHAHQRHQRFEQQKQAGRKAGLKHDRASANLDPDDTELVDKLEQLDDLVYDAIGGKQSAMKRLRSYWPEIREELSGEFLDESCEQYLRYAMAVWEEAANAASARQPSRAVEALDVLCILFDAA